MSREFYYNNHKIIVPDELNGTFHIILVKNKNDVSYVKKTNKVIDDSLSILMEYDKEYKTLTDYNYGGDIRLYAVADDGSDIVRIRLHYSCGYCIRYRTFRFALEYALMLEETKHLVKKFAYKGNIEDLDLRLYCYNKLTSSTYNHVPINVYGDYNGMFISRNMASVVDRNYCYKIDISSIDRNLLIEKFPDMGFGMIGGNINGTFIYLGQTVKVDLGSMHKVND